MSNFLQEGEQALNSVDGNQQQQSQGGSSGGGQQQSQGQGGSSGSSSSGGGGGGGGMEDTFVNKEVDGFATKEGLPSGMDNTINKEVDSEVGKF